MKIWRWENEDPRWRWKNTEHNGLQEKRAKLNKKIKQKGERKEEEVKEAWSTHKKILIQKKTFQESQSLKNNRSTLSTFLISYVSAFPYDPGCSLFTISSKHPSRKQTNINSVWEKKKKKKKKESWKTIKKQLPEDFRSLIYVYIYILRVRKRICQLVSNLEIKVNI